MKRWSAIELCLIVLTLTIPVTMAGVIIIRLVTGSPISGEAAEIIKSMMQIIGGGVIGIIAGIQSSNKQNDTTKHEN